MSVNTVRADSMVRAQVNTADRIACLRQVSYADRDKAFDAQRLIAKKKPYATTVEKCVVCRGYHIKRAGES